MKKKYVLLFLLLITLLIIICIYNKYIFIFQKINCSNTYNYGIIDGSLNGYYSNLITNEENKPDKNEINEKTHGDEVVQFINEISNYPKIYYYNAYKGGIINDRNIIMGLEWMLSNNVEKVNISLSSKYDSINLEEWIANHQDEIKIYCSYNNKINSCDYPAMYEFVIASGHNNILYKKIDKKYRSNKIIYLPRLKIYKGTTFLSVITMLEN